MMQTWGHAAVSSALEVYIVLTTVPIAPTQFRRWKDLLSIEPPIWGSLEAERRAQALGAAGLRVWSWDDYAVVYSDPRVLPPEGVHYRPWHLLAPHDTCSLASLAAPARA